MYKEKKIRYKTLQIVVRAYAVHTLASTQLYYKRDLKSESLGKPPQKISNKTDIPFTFLAKCVREANSLSS